MYVKINYFLIIFRKKYKFVKLLLRFELYCTGIHPLTKKNGMSYKIFSKIYQKDKKVNNSASTVIILRFLQPSGFGSTFSPFLLFPGCTY